MLGALIGISIKHVGRSLNSNNNDLELQRLAGESVELYKQHRFNYGDKYFFKMSETKYVRAYIHIGVRTKDISRFDYESNYEIGSVTKKKQGSDIFFLTHLEYEQPTKKEVASIMKTIKLIKKTY